jgi:rhamnosyltransferase
MSEQKVTVVLPVRNAGPFAQIQVDAFLRQEPRPHVIVIDSESNDGTPDVYRAGGCEVVPIRHIDFDHGATRNFAMTLCDADIIVWMTHDCILHRPDSIAKLVAAFDDPKVGVAYGRQLPRRQAGPIERHARLFNYPDRSATRSWPAARSLGIKAAFNSNTFSATRRVTLDQVNGWPERCLIGEDQMLAAKALLAGWSVAYVADALVEHSHGYTVKKEFQRYFEMGVCYSQASDLFSEFPSAAGEGKWYVLSEVRYLMKEAPWRLPEAALRTATKLLAYNLGKHEASLPARWKQRMTMYPLYFTERASQ